MNISRLQAQNVKSFDTVDVEPGDFNVLIGANASGKSNFLNLLTFLRDLAQNGVENAVSMQSGEIDLLRNVQIGGLNQRKSVWRRGTVSMIRGSRRNLGGRWGVVRGPLQ